MKRTITSILSITLALVMVLSLVACGGEKKTAITILQFTEALKNAHTDVELTKQDDKYVWSGEVTYGFNSDIKITVDNEDQVLSATITNTGGIIDSLTSADGVFELMDKVNSGNPKVGEATACINVSQVLEFIEMISEDNSAEEDLNNTAKAFSGGCNVNGWQIKASADVSKKEVVITFE